MDNKIIIEELNKRFFDEADFIYLYNKYGRLETKLGLTLDKIEEIINDFFEKRLDTP